MGITEDSIPPCTVEIMHGNSSSRAASAVVTCPDKTEIYELARLAHSMVVRVPGHASKTNTAFRKIPRIRWFMPREHTRKGGGKGVWQTQPTGKGWSPWSNYGPTSHGKPHGPPQSRGALPLQPDPDSSFLDGGD